MTINLLSRKRLAAAREVQEPTLLALALAVVGSALLLGACILGILFLLAFGYIWWTFAALSAILAWLVFSPRRRPKLDPRSLAGRQRWYDGISATARFTFIGLLASWLGLIGWSAVCRGGPLPPAKADPASIRVVTWNLHCGQEKGLPWKQFDWPRRKHALQAALEQIQPDILCVQEATPEQVAFLEAALPGHCRVGLGRDDGRDGGEHCAIYFNRERFEEIAGNTFWLEEPIDQPGPGSGLDVKRICTWVRLRDRASGRTFRVFNAHLYLLEAPRLTAAELILAQIAAGDPTEPVLFTADFNCSPAAGSRKRFSAAGLTDTAERAGKPVGQPTFQLYGIGLSCLDGILVNEPWQVRNHVVVMVKPHNVFPSDHFAVLTDVALAR